MLYSKVINQILVVVGICVVLGAAMLMTTGPWQIVVVVIGLLLLEAGVWQLAYHVLPERRVYDALRAEVERFIMLVRQLNSAALAMKRYDTPEARKIFDELLDAMRMAIDDIAAVVGKADTELPPERQRQSAPGRSKPDGTPRNDP